MRSVCAGDMRRITVRRLGRERVGNSQGEVAERRRAREKGEYGVGEPFYHRRVCDEHRVYILAARSGDLT